MSFIQVSSVKAWTKHKVSEFEVVFKEKGPLGLELMWPGAGSTNKMNEKKSEGKQDDDDDDDDEGQHRPTIVCGFHRSSDGTLGVAEKCGKIHVGDHLVAHASCVNS